jgi:hypothetical protein
MSYATDLMVHSTSSPAEAWVTRRSFVFSFRLKTSDALGGCRRGCGCCLSTTMAPFPGVVSPSPTLAELVGVGIVIMNVARNITTRKKTERA